MGNSDFNASHDVAGSLGVVGSASGTIPFLVYGAGNGVKQTCSVYMRNLNTGAVYSGAGNSTASGAFSYLLTVSLPVAGTYAISAYCTLAHRANLVSWVYAITTPPP